MRLEIVGEDGGNCVNRLDVAKILLNSGPEIPKLHLELEGAQAQEEFVQLQGKEKCVNVFPKIYDSKETCVNVYIIIYDSNEKN